MFPQVLRSKRVWWQCWSFELHPGGHGVIYGGVAEGRSPLPPVAPCISTLGRLNSVSALAQNAHWPQSLSICLLSLKRIPDLLIFHHRVCPSLLLYLYFPPFLPLRERERERERLSLLLCVFPVWHMLPFHP